MPLITDARAVRPYGQAEKPYESYVLLSRKKINKSKFD